MNVFADENGVIKVLYHNADFENEKLILLDF